MKMNTFQIVVLIGACFVTVLMRTQDTPHGLDSMIALALICGAVVRHPAAILLPLAIRLLTDTLLWARTGYGFYPSVLFDYSAYLLIVLLARYVPAPRYVNVVAGGLIGPCLFFLISNLGVWALWPDTYASTLTGLMTCYAQGIPFFKSSIAGNFVFALVFLGSWHMATVAVNSDTHAVAKAEQGSDI